ncbi:MAG: 4-vinyl reductase [Anaerolineales bacterium]|nr:4-vinyl reductase [Anaerolineales bacterium]
MQAHTLSGYFLPNRFARIALESTEELVSGPVVMQALLEGAGLSELVNNYPPANMERGFDFAYFAALTLGMETLYGPRGGRSLALRVGRQTFGAALSNFGALAGTSDAAFRLLPLGLKLRAGLGALAGIYSRVSDQTSRVEDTAHELHYVVLHNAACWGRQGEEKPVCYFMVGLLQGAIAYLTEGRELRVDEAECQAVGHKHCRFVVYKKS